MIKELCVIGHPSYCGGADTELFDQIRLWHKMGIKVFICHTGPICGPLVGFKKALQEEYGCTYMRPRQWNEVKGFHCISFCNGQFLRNLRHIKKYARTTTFVNCMTWNFKDEIKMQERGYIDFHLYQTDHGLDKVSKFLKHLKPYRPLRFDPYFDTTRFPYIDNRSNDHFRFGRMSREDATKFAADQFEIFDRLDAPVLKSGLVMGWGHNPKEKLKIESRQLSDIDGKMFYKSYVQLLKEGKVTQQEFYKFSDVFLMSSDTFENLPRVGFEAMASGSILVVNNRGGWQLQVNDGATGYLCDTTEDFIRNSSFLAHNPGQKEEIRRSARHKLETEWGEEKAARSWENIFNEWEKIR